MSKILDCLNFEEHSRPIIFDPETMKIDFKSQSAYQNQEYYNESKVPVDVEAKGNCLFEAMSVALTGKRHFYKALNVLKTMSDFAFCGMPSFVALCFALKVKINVRYPKLQTDQDGVYHALLNGIIDPFQDENLPSVEVCYNYNFNSEFV